MFKRFVLVLRSWFGSGNEKLDDPDLILQQAIEEIRTIHVENRARAIACITHKNRVKRRVAQIQRRTRILNRIASKARRRNDTDRLKRIENAKTRMLARYERGLQRVDDAFADLEAARQQIRREDERIREKTREALRLKAQSKESQFRRVEPGITSEELPKWLNDPSAPAVLLLIVVNLVLGTLLCLALQR